MLLTEQQMMRVNDLILDIEVEYALNTGYGYRYTPDGYGGHAWQRGHDAPEMALREYVKTHPRTAALVAQLRSELSQEAA